MLRGALAGPLQAGARPGVRRAQGHAVMPPGAAGPRQEVGALRAEQEWKTRPPSHARQDGGPGPGGARDGDACREPWTPRQVDGWTSCMEAGGTTALRRRGMGQGFGCVSSLPPPPPDRPTSRAQVIAGSDRGTVGRIVSVQPKTGTVKMEDVNTKARGRDMVGAPCCAVGAPPPRRGRCRRR